MTPETLKSFLAVLRDARALRFKSPEFSVELSPLAFVSDGPTTPLNDQIGAAAGFPTEEEFLFASSPFPVEAHDAKQEE